MKKIIKKISLVAPCLIMSLLVSCENEIPFYSGDNYIYFTNKEKDSTYFNFAYNRTPLQSKLAIEVRVTGNVSMEDRAFNVIIDENSTADRSQFSIDKSSCIVRAGRVVDTLWLTINNYSALRNSKHLILLQLDSNSQFNLIFEDKTKSRIFISDQLEHPKWWDSECETEGLGVYSDIKYREFIRYTGVWNLDINSVSFEDKRNYMLQFKYYLQRLKDAGTPIMDGDKEMSVTING